MHYHDVAFDADLLRNPHGISKASECKVNAWETNVVLVNTDKGSWSA